MRGNKLISLEPHVIVLQNILTTMTNHYLEHDDISLSEMKLIDEMTALVFDLMRKGNIPVILMGNLARSDYDRIRVEYQEKLAGYTPNREGFQAWIIDFEAERNFERFLVGGL